MKPKANPKTRNYSNGAADTSISPVIKPARKVKVKPTKPTPNNYGGVNA